MVTVYWKAGASGNASTVANWNTALDGSGTDQAPATGDDVIFAQGGNCTWDIAGATAIPNSITLATGYTGTVTQGDVDISIGAGGYSQAAGTATFNEAKTVTCAGSFDRTHGTISNDGLRLIMTGSGTTATVYGVGGWTFRSLQVSADITITYTGAMVPCTRGLTVDSGKTLTIPTGKQFDWAADTYGGQSFSNHGTIAGAGTFGLQFYADDRTITLGAVNCTVKAYLSASAAASRTLTLGANATLGGALTVISAHATNTITLDLNSKSLTCASLSIGTRGVLTGTGTLTADSITVGASGLFTDTNVTYDKTKVVGQTITWTAAEAANASATTSWSLNRAPFHNDNVVFDATSTNNCAWNIPATIVPNSITLATGYTGTVTQGAVDMSIGAGGFSMAAGTFTAVETKKVTCAGPFVQSGGTLTTTKLALVMTGDSTALSIYTDKTFYSLRASANITNSGAGQLIIGAGGLVVDSGKTLAIGTGKNLVHNLFSGAGYALTNNGTIAGPGTYISYINDADKTVTFGTINAPVSVQLYTSAAAGRTLTLGANTAFGGALTIISNHATYTITLATSTYTLTCGALTLGARGVISQGTGTLTCSSYTQNGASSVFTQGGPVVVSGDTAVSDGTLTGLATATWTAGGNWTTSGSATVTASVLNLIMSGDGKTISGTINVRSLRLSGNTTITSWMIVNWAGLSLIVDAGKNLHFAAGGYIDLRVYIGTSINIAGTTSSVGTGKLLINLRSAGITADLHNVGSALEIRCRSNVDGNYAVTASAPVNCITLTIASDHASNTVTLDLAGHSLTARGITVGTRGVLLGGEGVIRNYGNLDTSAGALDAGTSQYVQAAPGTIKLAAGHSFNDLIVESKAAGSSLLSNVTVNGIYAHVPELATEAFTLTKNGPEYTGRRRPLRKLIKKKMVWESLADMLLLEDIERVSA